MEEHTGVRITHTHTEKSSEIDVNLIVPKQLSNIVHIYVIGVEKRKMVSDQKHTGSRTK